jgi:hypothetical protein
MGKFLRYSLYERLLRFEMGLALVLLCSSGFAARQDSKSSKTKAPMTCNSFLGTLQDGESKMGYTNSTSLPGVPCEQQTVTCMGGVLVGNPNLFPSCVNTTQDCDGTPHGGVLTGYQTAIQPCAPATATCINGNWTAPKPVTYCN